MRDLNPSGPSDQANVDALLAAVDATWLAYWDITHSGVDLEALANQICCCSEFVGHDDQAGRLAVQVRRAWVAYLQGNWPQAEKLVLTCLAQAPPVEDTLSSRAASDLAKAYALQGLLLASRNQLGDARKCFKQAKHASRWDETATWGQLFAAQKAWYQAKQFKYKVSALRHLGRATVHGIGACFVWAWQGYYPGAQTSGSYALGQQWLQNAKTLLRVQWQWWCTRLKPAFAEHDPYTEVEGWLTAHEACPGWSFYGLKLAEACLQEGAFDSAWLWLQQVIQRRPTQQAAHWQLAELMLTQGRFDEAVAVYRLLVELDPTNALLHINLANVYTQQMNLAAATVHYKAALNCANCAELMGPWKSWVARSLGDLYIQQQQLEQAQGAYRLAHQLNPHDIESGIALSLTHIEQADLGNARLVLEGMLSRGIVDARVYTNLGYLLWLSGLPEQAQSAYETALALDPSDPLPFNNLGVLWLDAKNQPTEAIPLFEKALALNPDYTLAYYNLGRAQCLLGQTNAALLNLQKAKSLNASAPELDPADIVQLIEQTINFGLRPTDPLSSDNIPWDLRATG